MAMFVHMRYEQVKICPVSKKGGVDKFSFEGLLSVQRPIYLNPCIQQVIVTNCALFSEAMLMSWISYMHYMQWSSCFFPNAKAIQYHNASILPNNLINAIINKYL